MKAENDASTAVAEPDADHLTPLTAWELVKKVVDLKYPKAQYTVVSRPEGQHMRRYTVRSNQVLREVVRNLKFRFRTTLDINVENVTLDTRVSTMRTWAGVSSDRQLARILSQVDEIQVQSRNNGVITYRLDFTPLREFDSTAIKSEFRKQEQQERAANAETVRKWRESKRAEQQAAQLAIDAGIVSGFVQQQEGAVSRAWASGAISMHQEYCGRSADRAVSRAWAAGIISGYRME